LFSNYFTYKTQYLSLFFYPTPPPAQAQAHETQAQAQAQVAQAHTHLAFLCAGCFAVFCWGGMGSIALANFSKLTTKLFALFSTAVAMLFANSEPGIEGAF
jgi:hypothetical protein